MIINWDYWKLNSKFCEKLYVNSFDFKLFKSNHTKYSNILKLKNNQSQIIEKKKDLTFKISQME